jgi:hypothetical protein
LARTDSQRREAIRRLEQPVETTERGEEIRPKKLTGRDPSALTYRRIQKHQRTLLQLVGRWRKELNPLMWKNSIRNLGKRGVHHGSEGSSMAWQVNQNGTVSLCLPLETGVDRESGVAYRYLRQHLASSDLFWLVNDPQRGLLFWKETGGREIILRKELLLAIDRSCQDIMGQIPYPLSANVGPILAFSDTIWTSVIDNVYDNLSYQIETDPESGFHLAKYGAYTVAITGTYSDAQGYIEGHREFKEMWKTDQRVAEVRRLMEMRNGIAGEIDDVLVKLLVDSNVPGRCEGCP